jgi:hypothetical protein
MPKVDGDLQSLSNGPWDAITVARVHNRLSQRAMVGK